MQFAGDGFQIRLVRQFLNGRRRDGFHFVLGQHVLAHRSVDGGHHDFGDGLLHAGGQEFLNGLVRVHGVQAHWGFLKSRAQSGLDARIVTDAGKRFRRQPKQGSNKPGISY